MCLLCVHLIGKGSRCLHNRSFSTFPPDFPSNPFYNVSHIQVTNVVWKGQVGPVKTLYIVFRPVYLSTLLGNHQTAEKNACWFIVSVALPVIYRLFTV